MLRAITVCLLLCGALNQVVARPQTSEVTQFPAVFSTSVKKVKCEGAIELAKETLKYLQMILVTIPNGLKYIAMEIYGCARSENAGILVCSRQAAEAVLIILGVLLNMVSFLVSTSLGAVMHFIIYCILGGDYAKLMTLVTHIAT